MIPTVATIREILAGLDGDHPAGCEACGAISTLVIVAPGVFSLTVHHDSWCPVLSTIETQR